MDRRYIDRRYIDRRYIDRRYIDRRYIDRRYIDRRYIDRRYIDRRYIDRRYIDRRYIDRRYHFQNSLISLNRTLSFLKILCDLLNRLESIVKEFLHLLTFLCGLVSKTGLSNTGSTRNDYVLYLI